MGIHADLFEKSSSKMYWRNQGINSLGISAIAQKVANKLQQFGFKSSDKVVYLSDQSPFNFILCEIALSNIGCTLIPNSFKSIKENVKDLLINTSFDFLLLDSKVLLKWLIQKENFILISELNSPFGSVFLVAPNILGNKTSTILEKDSTILMSSGTTSNKKYIIQSSENFKIAIEVFSSSSIFNNKSKYLNLLPLYFSGGRKVFYSCISNDIDIVFATDFKIDTNFDISSGTPYLLQQLLNKNSKIPPHVFISGGASLPRKLIEKAGLESIQVCNVYGLTETSSIGTLNDNSSKNITSIGQWFPINQYKIQESILFVKGPTVCQNSMYNGSLKSLLDDEDWLMTNDYVEIVEDNFYLKGRKGKEFKLSNGLFTNEEKLIEIIDLYIEIEFFKLEFVKNSTFNLLMSDQFLNKENSIQSACLRINQNEFFNISNLKFFRETKDLLSFTKEIIVDSEKLVHQIQIS